MLTGRPYDGTSGTYFRTSSSSDSLPSSASSRTDAAVNCLETEPMSNTVAGVIGMPSSTLARP